MASNYPVDSSFQVEAIYKNDRTRLGRTYVAQPYGVSRPFPWREDGIKIFQRSSAPGLLEGDSHYLRIDVQPEAKMWLTSQSYEKIYQSKVEGSTRRIEINVGDNGYLRYMPLPSVPYYHSILDSEMKVNLSSDQAMFAMVEVLTAGRIAKGEVFEYKQYKSLIDIYEEGHLIYRDNTNFKPEESDMKGFGMYEGYTHLSNVLLMNFHLEDEHQDRLKEIINEYDDIEGGVTKLATGDFMIRLLGYEADEISKLSERLVEEAENIVGL